MIPVQYDRKLRRWLISIMFLIFCSLVSSIMAMNNVEALGPDIGYKLVKLSGGLAVFLIGFHHLAWWHLVDLFDRDRRVPSQYAWLMSYGAFLLIYSARTAAIGLGASGVWDTNVLCGGIFLILTQSCVGPPITLSLTVSFFSMAAYFLCLAKTVAAIRSRGIR